MIRRGLSRSAAGIRSCRVTCAGAFAVGLAGLERDDVAVPGGQQVQVQLVFAFQGGDPLVGVQGGGQGAQQRGLPGVDAPGDDDVLACPHRAGQEVRQLRGHGGVAGVAQLLQGDVDQAVAADAHVHLRGDRHDRGEPDPGVVQGRVQHGAGGGELAGGLAFADAPGADHLHQLAVAGGDRPAGHPPPVPQRDPDLPRAVDVDVLHVGVIDVGLQRAEPELLVQHRAGQGVPRPRRGQFPAGAGLLFRPRGDVLIGQGAGLLAGAGLPEPPGGVPEDLPDGGAEIIAARRPAGRGRT